MVHSVPTADAGAVPMNNRRTAVLSGFSHWVATNSGNFVATVGMEPKRRIELLTYSLRVNFSTD